MRPLSRAGRSGVGAGGLGGAGPPDRSLGQRWLPRGIAGAYLLRRGWETRGGAAVREPLRPPPRPGRGGDRGPSALAMRRQEGGGGGLEVLNLGVPQNHLWSLLKLGAGRGENDTRMIPRSDPQRF